MTLVNVLKSYPKIELTLQDFLDVEYVPLETSTEFITMAIIDDIGKDIIIFRNRNDGKIFIYDRKGRGLRVINRFGQGGEEYTFVLSVTLDEDNNEIFVNDPSVSKIYVYDLFGEYKRSFEHKNGLFYNNIYNFDRDHLICNDGNRDFGDEKKNMFLIISKQNGSIVREIQIPYNEQKSTILMVANDNLTIAAGARNKELIPYGEGWVLVEPSSDTIYSYSPDQNMIPFIVRTPSIQTMNPEVFLFPGVLTDRYYFMQTVKKEYDFSKDDGFPRTDLVYDKQTNAVYESVVYNGDFSNKIPVDMVYGGIALLNNEIAFIYKMEAYQIVESYEKGELKGELKEIAAGLSEDSNPVIMIAKHKK